MCIDMKTFCIVFLLAIASPFAHESDQDSSQVIEISFGSSLLFLEQNFMEDGVVETATFPVSSVVFLAEWILWESVTLPLAFNIPVEPFRKFVDSTMVEEHVSATVGIGINWTVVTFQTFAQAELDLQLSAMLFMDINPVGDRALYPIPIPRLHIETPNGFTLYFGGSFVPGTSIMALMYGVGHRF